MARKINLSVNRTTRYSEEQLEAIEDEIARRFDLGQSVSFSDILRELIQLHIVLPRRKAKAEAAKATK